MNHNFYRLPVQGGLSPWRLQVLQGWGMIRRGVQEQGRHGSSILQGRDVGPVKSESVNDSPPSKILKCLLTIGTLFAWSSAPRPQLARDCPRPGNKGSRPLWASHLVAALEMRTFLAVVPQTVVAQPFHLLLPSGPPEPGRQGQTRRKRKLFGAWAKGFQDPGLDSPKPGRWPLTLCHRRSYADAPLLVTPSWKNCLVEGLRNRISWADCWICWGLRCVPCATLPHHLHRRPGSCCPSTSRAPSMRQARRLNGVAAPDCGVVRGRCRCRGQESSWNPVWRQSAVLRVPP